MIIKTPYLKNKVIISYESNSIWMVVPINNNSFYYKSNIIDDICGLENRFMYGPGVVFIPEYFHNEWALSPRMFCVSNDNIDFHDTTYTELINNLKGYLLFV